MRVLVSNAHTALGIGVTQYLSTRHDVRALGLGSMSPSGGFGFIAGDARDRAVATDATNGCHAVIQIVTSTDIADSPLDAIDSATRGTYNHLTTGNSLSRFIVVSSLRLFERYSESSWVTEQWAPRPTTDPNDLVPFLAEATAREAARVLPIIAVGLRLGEVVGDGDVATRRPDSRWLHLEDACAAIDRALTFEAPSDGQQHGWWVFHLPGAGTNSRFSLAAAGQPPFGFRPTHDVTSGAEPSPRSDSAADVTSVGNRPGGAPRRVVVFGAGGPLAAVAARAIERDHVLRLTDARSLEELVQANRPQSPGAPMPRVLPPPHEATVVDVTDPSQVAAACQGMDAIINCTVVRPDPVQAFRVNTLGAYNVLRGALATGIRRVVHTGPQQVTIPYPAGYWYDFDLDDNVPPRPGASLYILSKFLGQEICRIFAEEHNLEVPCLLFSSFVEPSQPAPETYGAFAFSVSWDDAGEAMRLALRAPAFPRPFEVFHILADLPHRKYSNAKAKRLLNWQPRDTLENHWTRPSQTSARPEIVPSDKI